MAGRRRRSTGSGRAAAVGRERGGRSQQDARVHEWKARFLQVYGHTPKIAVACALAGISRRTYYDTREKDPAFAEAADDARADAVDCLLEEMTRRVGNGSVTLALAILAHHDPAWDPDRPAPPRAPPPGPAGLRLDLALPLPPADAPAAVLGDGEAGSGSADGGPP